MVLYPSSALGLHLSSFIFLYKYELLINKNKKVNTINNFEMYNLNFTKYYLLLFDIFNMRIIQSYKIK